MVDLYMYENWSDIFSEFDSEDEIKGVFLVLQWVYDIYGDLIIYVLSFGIEGIVLIDLILKVKKDVEIVFLDMGVYFKEIYEVIDVIKECFFDLCICMKKLDLMFVE